MYNINTKRELKEISKQNWMLIIKKCIYTLKDK